jgi:phosphate transport system protein
MRLSFHDQLDALKRDLLKMGIVVSEAIRKAVQALAKQDEALAREVVDSDDAIDQMYLDIEKRCFQMMALQQPMASDLRTIGTVLKISTDLERIGDHASDIAKTVLRMSGEPLITELVDIPRMADRVQLMIREALEAFVAQDAERARKMMGIDDEIDATYGKILEEIMEIIQTQPLKARQATYLLMCALWLERVGDHATNLGEWTIYMVTGALRETDS